MQNIPLAICWWLVFLGIFLAKSGGIFAQEKIKLTPDEKAWIQSNPVIRVHNEKDWPPFNFFEDDKPRGFSIDYMNLLAGKSQVNRSIMPRDRSKKKCDGREKPYSGQRFIDDALRVIWKGVPEYVNDG